MSFLSTFYNRKHDHITRSNDSVIIGTQNPIPELLEENNQNNDNQNTQNHEMNEKTDEKGTNTENQNQNAQKFITHIVREGENLQDIADQYSIPLSLLKSINRIFNHDLTTTPGEELKILTDIKLAENLKPISVTLYDAKVAENNVNGKLSLKDFKLIFKPKTFMGKKLIINLAGYLESTVMLSPDDIIVNKNNLSDDSEIMILVLNYLSDPSNHKSMITNYFKGIKKELENYQIEIIKAADIIQAQNNINHPNPDSIAYTYKEPETNSSMSTFNLKVSQQPESSVKPYSSLVSTKSRMRMFLPKIDLQGESNILNMRGTDIFNIRKQLPRRFQNSNWNLLYQMSIHGVSTQVLFSLTADQRPLLLLIKTNYGEAIGSFLSTGFTLSDNFYGNGEIFVFKLQPTFEAYHWDPSSENKSFIFTSLENITIGGGGTSSIFIDRNLLKAFSEPCSTFHSPSLTSQQHFEVHEMEVWKVG